METIILTQQSYYLYNNLLHLPIFYEQIFGVVTRD